MAAEIEGTAARRRGQALKDVVVYKPGYDAEHDMVLEAFACGVANASGYSCEIRPVTSYRECDVAVIYGLAKHKVPKTMSKAPIIAKHMGHRRLIVIDSAPIKRGTYWQIGWGSGLGNRLDFLNDKSPPLRWHSFGIPLKPWQVRGPSAPIIVCGQIPWDANVQDTDHIQWIRDWVRFYRECGQHVLFRPHPKMHLAYGAGIAAAHHTDTLANALAQARIMVTYNSTVGTDAVIAGVPTIAMDKGSFAWPVTGHDALEIKPEMLCFNRDQWAANLAYCVWNLEEIRNGTAWAHLAR